MNLGVITKQNHQGFPGGLVVNSLPASEGDTGLISGPGRDLICYKTTPYEPQLLSPLATTPEACMPKARALQQEKPLQWEDISQQLRADLIRCNKRKVHTAEKTHHSQKQINLLKLTKLHDISNRNIKEKGTKENHKNDQRTINKMARTTCTSIV